MALATFGGALFASSALLFLIEPMFAKMALPLLGGSPQVWNTCVVFFQAMLLAGYAYAHATARLGPRRQAVLHIALVLLAFAALPIGIGHGWNPPTTGAPIPWLLALLGASVGVPFFVLASTAPLLQKWFSATGHRSSSDPYFLYVASNAGSLLGLLAYPFLLEPLLRLPVQSRLWSFGYAAFCLLTAACAARFVLAGGTAAGGAGARVSSTVASFAERLSWKRRLRWLGLSLVPSSLMLGVTTYLSTDIAAVPLLWIVPLSVYLATFMLAFASRNRGPSIAERILPAAVLPLVLTMIVQAAGPLWFLVPLHLIVFFLAALTCHRRLAADRPAPAHLTEFYLWVAAGGALGGMLNVLVAPHLFTGILEYPLMIVLACACRGAAEADSRSRAEVLLPIAAAAGVYVVLFGARLAAMTAPAAFAALACPALVTFRIWRRPASFAAALALIFLAGQSQAGGERRELLFARRTFFGVHRVYAETATGHHTLSHGTTLHGRQSTRPSERREPLTYFARRGPIGQVFAALPRLQGSARVAVIGLGSGTLATYAREGQQWTFYEIDPAVERIARDPAFFTFLHDSPARPSVVLGDARLSLARAPAGCYDLIVVDAFSSDAIPVHLITTEALQLYLARLAEGGAVAFHISNGRLALQPVVGRLAADQRLAALAQLDLVPEREEGTGRMSSEWVVVARRAEDLAPLTRDPRWSPPSLGRGVAWTDDFSNIWSVLKIG